ncbi:MAG: hypothetical protein M0Z52_03995 [Actinomycetota bacterium]|nr:hypothetical protein [Actinomycetota bacterium]
MADFIVNGDGNITAGRDVNINARVTKRYKVNPTAEHITPAQKQTIQEKLTELVDIGVIAGKSRDELFPHWWGRLKRKFRASTYHELFQDQYDDVLLWLAQQKAILRPKLRRRDNDAWRKEHYTAIWTKTRALGISKPQVYELVAIKLGKAVESLTELGERDLKKLYGIIMRLK